MDSDIDRRGLQYPGPLDCPWCGKSPCICVDVGTVTDSNSGNEVGAPDDTNPKDLIGLTKPPLDLIPPAAEIHLAMAMGNGAEKYGAYNWRSKDVRAMVYLAAAKRHIASYLDGEQEASDSGVHHLAHAMACMAIVLDAEEGGNLVDDRPPPGMAAKLIARLTRSRTP